MRVSCRWNGQEMRLVPQARGERNHGLAQAVRNPATVSATDVLLQGPFQEPGRVSAPWKQHTWERLRNLVHFQEPINIRLRDPRARLVETLAQPAHHRRDVWDRPFLDESEHAGVAS